MCLVGVLSMHVQVMLRVRSSALKLTRDMTCQPFTVIKVFKFGISISRFNETCFFIICKIFPYDLIAFLLDMEQSNSPCRIIKTHTKQYAKYNIEIIKL